MPLESVCECMAMRAQVALSCRRREWLKSWGCQRLDRNCCSNSTCPFVGSDFNKIGRALCQKGRIPAPTAGKRRVTQARRHSTTSMPLALRFSRTNNEQFASGPTKGDPTRRGKRSTLTHCLESKQYQKAEASTCDSLYTVNPLRFKPPRAPSLRRPQAIHR
jgi:hypothetical protein